MTGLGIKGFSSVESGEPLLVDSGTPAVSVGFRNPPVVDDIARDKETDLWDVRHRCRLRVGVTNLDRNKRRALEFKAPLVNDGHVEVTDG